MTGRFRTIAPSDSPDFSDVDQRFAHALGPALRRQLWLRFFTPGDDDQGVVIQLDELPMRPAPDAAEQLAHVLSSVADQGAWTTLSVAFERRGRPDPTSRDTEWMHVVHTASGAAALNLGTVMICHSRGVRAYVERRDG